MARKRNTVLVLMLCLIGALLGCANKTSPVQAGYKFVDALQLRDFPAAYALLSKKAQSQITSEDFCTKYERIFEALELEEIEIHAQTLEEQELITRFQYDATYITGIAGELPLSFSMSLVQQNGWKVDWTPALIHPGMTWGDTLSIITLPPKRGEIFSGETIYARNVPATTIYVSREKADNMLSLSQALGPLISMPPTDIADMVRKIKGDIVLIKSFLPDELDEDLRAQILLIPGVGIDYGNYATIRYYPMGSTLAHTLGYCGAISKKELEAARKAGFEYSPDAIIGKSGLELAYEAQLRGSAGKEYYIADSSGNKKQSIFVSPAKDGNDIHLTINPKLQKRLENVVAFSLKPQQTGAVIVMNPDNGNILALASYPSYDLNRFVRGISPIDWQAMQDPASNQPLFNRLTQGLFPPGSSFKPFTAAFGLDSGAITPDTEFTEKIDNDYWLPARSDWFYPRIKRATWNHRKTPLNMLNAMIPSDNIYFAFCAMKMGEDIFTSKCASIGVGESIPFDLPVTRSRLLNEGTQMNIKILADSGYGQGEMLFSPLQLAATFASLAGTRNIYIPHVVESLYATDGRLYTPVMQAQPEIWKENVMSVNAQQTLLPMLEAVVTEGTAQSLKVRGVAGKTGTAEITETREISWFVGFTTNSGEKRLVLVVLEGAPGEGGAIKLDIARTMFNAG